MHMPLSDSTVGMQRDGVEGDLSGSGTIAATAQFPVDLQRMLNTAESMGMQDIISWQKNGTSFVVHKKEEFENQVMPR
jgi:HSF-type DNA-binding